MKRLISILLTALPVTAFAVRAEGFSALADSIDEYIEVWEDDNLYKGKAISIADGFDPDHPARYPQDDLLIDVGETGGCGK